METKWWWQLWCHPSMAAVKSSVTRVVVSCWKISVWSPSYFCYYIIAWRLFAGSWLVLSGQKLSRFLWNSNVRYRINKFRHLSLSWARSNKSMPRSHFLKIHFNITFLSTPSSSKCPMSFRSPHENPVCTSPVSYTCHMPCSSILRY